MTLRVSACLILLLLPLVSGLSVSAQDSPFKDRKIINFQPSDDKQIALARQLVAARRYQEAADILEVVYERRPDDRLIPNLLRTCYDQLEEYDKAELLARRLIEKEPNSLHHRLYLAGLLAKLGKTEESRAAYDTAEVLFEGNPPERLVVLIQSMMQSDLYDVALTKIDSLRQSVGDSTLFALQRGEILERQQHYKEAADEYVSLLAADTTSEANRAERKLLDMLEFEASAETVETALKARADSTASLRIMRLLADHHLKSHEFDLAFEYALRQDSLEGMSGVPLIEFMRRCYERQEWAQVARMAKAIIDRYPDSVYEVDVSFEYAAALARLGRPHEAISVYRQIMADQREPRFQADALYGIGAVYLEYMDRPDSALVYFDSVISLNTRRPHYRNALRALPVCYLRLGRLDDARQALENMADEPLPENMAEEVLYRRGLVAFFAHDYDTASVLLRRVTVDYPRGFYVNDALGLVMAIQDAADKREVLDAYASAGLLEFQGRLDSALTRYYIMVEPESAPLGDVVLHRIMQLELNEADTAAALSTVERLDKEFPESYYRPLGLKQKADILADGRDLKQALELYRLLLREYGDYPFAREVRESLRRFEADQPVG